MSLVLLAPIALLGFAALLLPVLLHLSRRHEHRRTPFAALRWLAGPAYAQRRWRLVRPWLLLLRLILLALCVCLLAQPVLRGDWRRTRDWVVVVPGINIAVARAQLPAGNASWHWLAPGFPEVDKSMGQSAPAIASLLRELDTDLPDGAALTVVAPAELEGLDGERIQLSRALQWIIVPNASAPPPIAAPAPMPVRIAIRYDAASEAGLRYARAILGAWNRVEPVRYIADIQTAEHAVDANSQWLWWLADEVPSSVDEWIKQGGTALIAAGRRSAASPLSWRDATRDPLAHITSFGRGRRIELTAALSPPELPAMFDADFPQRIMTLMRGALPAPTRASSAPNLADRGATRATAAALRLETPLIVLIALLFFLERLLAARLQRSAE